MLLKHIAIVIFAIVFVACGPRKKEEAITTETSDTVKTINTVAAVVAKDTVVIDSRAALYFDPDTVQIAKATREGPEDDFYTMADDYLFYMSEAGMFLDSVKLKRIDVEGKKILKFVKGDGAAKYVNMDTVESLWGIYFFDPAKDPYMVDILSPQDEYKMYFQ